MAIAEQFDKLIKPAEKDLGVMHAASIEGSDFAKLAINYLGEPIILIDSAKRKPALRRNLRLRYIELRLNASCTIHNSTGTQSGTFSLVAFRSAERSLLEYFFGIVDIFLDSLMEALTEVEVSVAFEGLIEIFRSLNEPPKSTIQGLWSELFLIQRSSVLEAILACWHSNPKDKFDFESGIDKIEVKSTRNASRVHTFSAEQLNADDDFHIVIASLFVLEKENGKSLLDLMLLIEERLQNSTLFFKVKMIAARTLGSGVEEVAQINFDYDLADQSLKFYDRKEIDHIESEHISARITEVHFKSDLSNIRPIIPSTLNPESYLFNAL